MAAIITTDMRVKNANQYIDTVSTDSVYFFVGKTQQWGSSDSASEIETPVDTWHDQQTAWQRMFAMKKIAGSDVSHAIPRYTWESGQTYAEYDDQDSALSTKRYYVITDSLSVYKCLKAGNGASYDEPTGTSPSVNAEEADGYIWKYMYTLTGTQTSKYLTGSYMPVETLTGGDDGSGQWDVQDQAIAGAIHNIKVTNGGSGYTSGTVSVTVTGDGSNCTATANVVAGVVDSITVTNIGSGYNQAKVTITDSGSGANATARAIISPEGGHGSNPVNELGGFYTITNIELDGAEGGDIATDNEYRQLGMILNPYDFGTSNVSNATTLRTTKSLTLTNVNGTFQPDDTITGQTSGVSAYIDSVDGSTIYYHQEEGTGYGSFTNGEQINAGSVTADISALGDPEAEPFSGQIIYLENRAAVDRATDQIEDVKLILEF